MKIIKTCIIGDKELELAAENIILELNNTGRGFVTVRTDEKCTGKSAVFLMGEYDHYYKWFDGFVEREQDALLAPGEEQAADQERRKRDGQGGSRENPKRFLCVLRSLRFATEHETSQ